MSHGATARHAIEHGDPVLGQICGAIAADEGRHEIAYQRIVDELWRLCAPIPAPCTLPVTYFHVELHAPACSRSGNPGCAHLNP